MIDMKAVKALVGGGSRASVLALLCRLFSSTKCRFNDGKPCVATPVRTLADMVEVSYASVARAISSLEADGVIKVERRRWNRSARLYISVPRETYEKVGAIVPDNCAFYESSDEPAFMGKSHVTACNINEGEVKHDTSHPVTCHVTYCNVLDHNKNLDNTIYQSSPADACGSASPEGSAVESGFSGGSMSKLKQRAEKTVAQVEVISAPREKWSTASIYADAMRQAGYACNARDPKFLGNVSTLAKKVAARGMNLREIAEALVNRWPEYRGKKIKYPEPWAVARYLDAFCALPTPSQAPISPPPPPPMPEPEKPPQQPPVKHESIFLKALKEKKT